jgi:AMP-binding enzyme
LPRRTIDEAPMVWRRDRPMVRRALLRRASALADRLPNGRYAINLCSGRAAFLTTFLALLMRRQTMLLPPNPAPGMLEEIGGTYDDALVIAEAPPRGIDLPQYRLDPAMPENGTPSRFTVPAEHVAAVTFTSGTTGSARPNFKSWRSLLAAADLAARRFGFELGSSIVATVPPQHMYGLETSIMLPLAIGAAVHDERPLFPQDVAICLAEMPQPRTLITTPIHLRACLEAGCVWPPLDLIISATAPLARASPNARRSSSRRRCVRSMAAPRPGLWPAGARSRAISGCPMTA